MSYIRAPRLHQSTARLCPLLIKISGALQQCESTLLTRELMETGQDRAVRVSEEAGLHASASESERDRRRAPLTCIQWCRRRCVWPCRRESILYTVQSLSTSRALGGKQYIFRRNCYIAARSLFTVMSMTWYWCIWIVMFKGQIQQI